MERADAVTRSCLIAAGLVVIPIESSALSAWASDRRPPQVQAAGRGAGDDHVRPLPRQGEEALAQHFG